MERLITPLHLNNYVPISLTSLLSSAVSDVSKTEAQINAIAKALQNSAQPANVSNSIQTALANLENAANIGLPAALAAAQNVVDQRTSASQSTIQGIGATISGAINGSLTSLLSSVPVTAQTPAPTSTTPSTGSPAVSPQPIVSYNSLGQPQYTAAFASDGNGTLPQSQWPTGMMPNGTGGWMPINPPPATVDTSSGSSSQSNVGIAATSITQPQGVSSLQLGNALAQGLGAAGIGALAGGAITLGASALTSRKRKKAKKHHVKRSKRANKHR